MDRLAAMEAFVGVADAGSFTRAAATLRMSTPMVTLHVQRLEAHLGARLFNRSTRRVALTAEGRQFLAYARAALEAYATAESALRPGNGIAGRVRLDVPASMGHAFVVPALAAFQRAHPRIILDLTFGDRGTALRVDGFDIVIRTGDVPISGWDMVKLGATRMLCLASPGYIAQHGAPATPQEIEAHRCIAYASVEQPGGNPWTMYQDGRKIRLRPQTAFTFNDGAAILAAARQGLGIAQTLEMLARDDLEAGRLVPLLPDIAWPRLSVVLMGARDRLALPHVEATLRFLVDQVAWKLDPDI